MKSLIFLDTKAFNSDKTMYSTTNNNSLFIEILKICEKYDSKIFFYESGMPSFFKRNDSLKVFINSKELYNLLSERFYTPTSEMIHPPRTLDFPFLWYLKDYSNQINDENFQYVIITGVYCPEYPYNRHCVMPLKETTLTDKIRSHIESILEKAPSFSDEKSIYKLEIS